MGIPNIFINFLKANRIEWVRNKNRKVYMGYNSVYNIPSCTEMYGFCGELGGINGDK